MAQDTKIYLKLDKKPKNVAEVLKSLWKRSNGVYLQAEETFKDENCNYQQCVQNKYRSIDDVYYLCKTYFPDITIKEVLHEILVFENNGKEWNPQLAACDAMKKLRVVPYKHSTYKAALMHGKLDSEWTWKELLDLLEIYNDEDLTKYREKHGLIERV